MRIDHKEVQLRFLNRGVQAIEELIDEGVSKHTLRRACSEMKKENHARAEALADVLRRHSVLRSRTGPSRPVPGEERDYSVQRVDDTDFVRLPVGLLGATKGEKVRASFSADCIVLTLARDVAA